MKNQPGSEHISIPFDSNLGEPMRRALSGLSGVMVGPDYMGKTVLAAYEPVAVLNLGIVTKIDIDEVREPFIKAGLITLFFTILIVLFSAGLFIRITRPMITQLEQRVIERTAELSDINYILEKEIVERRRAENALKESEERYKRLSDLTFEGILFHKDGIIIDFNQSFINLTGYHREELPGKNAVSLLVPEKYHPIVRQNMVKKIACPYEIEIIKKNGILVPIELRARDIVSDGREMRVVALRDISKRKKAEDELRNALLYTRSLIEASLDPLVTISVNGKITDLNKATEWVTGFSKEQLIGSDFADYFTEPGKATAGYQQVFEKENVRDYPLELRHRNGTITPVIYNASVYRDEYGKVIGVFAAARDISIRRRMERELIRAKEAAEAANLAKSEFIAHLSHELRTPLNGILGYTQILKRDIHLTDKQSEDIAIIQRSAEHLLLLINDLLDFSKIEAGKLELGNADIDLPELLKITADIASVQALQKGIVFVCEVSSELPRKVCGDQKRLRQVLLNLLGNAVKFTEKGSVTFKTELSFPDHEHVLIRFQVEDTGIGIPPSQIEKIFEPFHQINTIGMKNEGTGLGLAICRKLVRSMGGELYVSSVEGHGSVFRFEIKLLRAGEEMVHVNKKTICLPEPEQEVAAPPKEELIRLLEVLKTGDVVAIQAYTEQLKRPDSEFAFFGEKVYKLAKTLQLKQIKRLILQLTEHKT
jgi:PAS domain S-box-containing protein